MSPKYVMNPRVPPEAPEAPKIPSDLIKVSEAAKQVGKSVGYIYLHIRKGRLPAFKAGRHTYVSQAALDELKKPRLLVYVPYVSKPRAKSKKGK